MSEAAANITFGENGLVPAIIQDDETGDVLWTSPTLSNSLESFPISYEANGKQYVAVVTNWASGLGRLSSLTPEIRLPQDNPATLYVFALPEN